MKEGSSKNYMLNLYSFFSCMAEECPFTCCSGWEIEISPKDQERFQSLEPEWLRKDILENITEKKGHYYFKNSDTGNCSMLLENGLCKIQKYTSEQTLCNTCRKFPRIYGGTKEIKAFSMAASCPAVAHEICENNIFLCHRTPEGLLKTVYSDIPFCKRAISFYQKRCLNKKKSQEKNADSYLTWFDLLTDALLDSLLSSKTFLKKYILDLFSFYESEQPAKIIEKQCSKYLTEQQISYEKIRNSYIPYRIFSAWLEDPKEEIQSIYTKLCGELFLFLYFSFLLFQKQQHMTKKDWEFAICLTYRLMVHEKKIAEDLFLFFAKNLSDIEDIT